MGKVKKIIDSQLCLGCGMCQSILSAKCQMKINPEGFYFPEFKDTLTKKEEDKILKICPAVNVKSRDYTGVWGHIEQLSEAWSNDNVVRDKASSGGVISTLCIYLIENKIVDAILHVGISDTSYIHNELRVSRTKEGILRNASSRYAPALVFDKFIEILDNSPREVFAFVGKPCDIAGVKNFISEHPQYTDQIKYCLAIFCAGMPSYKGTESLLSLSGNKDIPSSIKYRGDGWPGYFKALYTDKPEFKMTYNDSWGNVLNRHLNFRCKICPDGIGLLADIAIGDSWHTKDGYPDFEEGDGKSFVIIRNPQGKTLFQEAIENNYITSQFLDVRNIENIQYSQYQRRKMMGYRILPIQLLSGFILKFKGLGIWRSMLSANLKMGLKNLLGTTKRFIKIIWG